MAWSLLVVAITMAMLTPCSAQAVEYVKVCSLYGAGFNYIPGTDTCYNPATNDARTQTEGGTWRFRVPDNPGRWVPIPQLACLDGRLVKFGDFTGANLTLNAHSRYETAPTALKLRPGQYISKVMYKGGFTNIASNALGAGSFCMFYKWQDPTLTDPSYSALGCSDTSKQATVPATLAFSPDHPTPPATTAPMSLVGAQGFPGAPPIAADIQGELSIWMCVAQH